MSDDAKGKQYMEEAEKKLKSSGSMFSSIFGSGSSKLDDAVELFQKAGNSFKIGKNWTMAGRAFCQAAEVQLKQNTKHEAASMYNEAANAYKKSDPNEALNCLSKSCDIYIDMVSAYCVFCIRSLLLVFNHNAINYFKEYFYYCYVLFLFSSKLKIGSLGNGCQTIPNYSRVIRDRSSRYTKRDSVL
jgi:hypothetical protein